MSDELERPFIEDGSQFGLSQDAFTQMEPNEQLELMIQWFFENFEDPANETPWDGEDKEYVYIWGGPYNANDEIRAKFEGLVTEHLLEEVVGQIEEDGVDWAPQPNSPFYDDGRSEEDEQPPESFPLDVFLDEPSEQYGSAQELEVRSEALKAIERLRWTLQTRRPIGIGHNLPPDTEHPDEFRELPHAVDELCAELQKTNPEIAAVKHWATPLRIAVSASAKWTLKKLDEALTAVVKVSAVATCGWLYNHPEHLHMAYDAIIKWLHLAARSVF